MKKVLSEIVRVLDNYYIVLVKRLGKMNYKAEGIMGFTIGTNLISLTMPIFANFIEIIYLFSGLCVMTLLIYIILLIRYNGKRRKQLMEKYNNEGADSYEYKTEVMIIYEVLSIVIVIFSFWLTSKLY